MTLQQLRYFKAIAEAHTFTRAASLLYVTQPNLTHSIHDLEAELQVPLFLRQGRTVKLTKYGELYLRHVNAALEELEKGNCELSELILGVAGSVSLSYLSSLNDYVPYFTSRYLYENPQWHTSFQMSQATTHQIEADLLEGRCELGFATRCNNSRLNFYPLGNHPTVLIVPAQSELARRTSVSIKALEAQPFIAYSKSCGIRNTNDEYLKQYDVHPKITNEAMFDNLIVGMVANNMGVSLIPRPTTSLFPRRIKIVPLQEPMPPREIHMLWLDNHQLSMPAQRFRDFIINRNFSLDKFILDYQAE